MLFEFFVASTRPVLTAESLFWEAAATPFLQGVSVGAVVSASDSVSCATNPSQESTFGAPDAVRCGVDS